MEAYKRKQSKKVRKEPFFKPTDTQWIRTHGNGLYPDGNKYIYNIKILLNINSTLLDLYGVTVFLAVNDPILYIEYMIQGIHVALEETTMLPHQNNLLIPYIH